MYTFFGTFFNIIPIFTNTFKADSNSNLIAHWSFDEVSGTIVHDSSGNFMMEQMLVVVGFLVYLVMILR